MLKLLWPLLIVSLRILVLIWQGTAHFVQDNATIAIPGDTRWNTSEFPWRTPANHFWRRIGRLEAQNVSYFSLFTVWYGFGNDKSLFVNISVMSSPVIKVAWFQPRSQGWSDFNAIPVSLHCWGLDNKLFHACWIMIGQFEFQARQPYARLFWS